MLTRKTLAVVMTAIMSSSVYAANVSQLVGSVYTVDKPAPLQSENYAVKVDNRGMVVDAYDAGMVGAGTDARALESAHVAPTAMSTETVESQAFTGQAAIDHFTTVEFAHIAAHLQVTPEFLKAQLLMDPTLKLDSHGNVLVFEAMARDPSIPLPPSATGYTGDVKHLHSKPDSTNKIYINYDGFNVPISSRWGGVAGRTYGGWNASDSEKFHAWTIVAEDYSTFDVDVTTEKPADNVRQIEIVVTTASSDGLCQACSGVAEMNSFGSVGNNAWVFGSNSAMTGETISHEAGHTLGLYHDGVRYDSGIINEYYAGMNGWSPIMGFSRNGYATWSNGTYQGATCQQDDAATINALLSAFGESELVDDIGGTMDTAVSLETDHSESAKVVIKPTYGIIKDSADTDMFVFNSDTGGTVQFALSTVLSTVADSVGNLDSKLTLTDSTGHVVAENAPLDSLDASIYATVEPGTYYLAVTSTYRPGVYTEEVSRGQYHITGSYNGAVDHTITPAPCIIDLGGTTGTMPFTINMDNSCSTDNHGSPATFSWSITLNGTEIYATTDTVVNYTATNPGMYIVTVKGINLDGLTMTTGKAVTVRPDPLAKISHVKAMSMKFVKTTTNKHVLYPTAKVTLKDTAKKSVVGATVCGYFTGNLIPKKNKPDTATAISSTEVCSVAVSDKSGNVTVASPVDHFTDGLAGTVSFRISNVTAANIYYDATANVKSAVVLTKK